MPRPTKKCANPKASGMAATRRSRISNTQSTFKTPPLKRIEMTFTMLNAIYKPPISDYSRFTSFEDPMKELYENAVLPTTENLNSDKENWDPWHQHDQDVTESNDDPDSGTTTSSDSCDLGIVKMEDCVEPSWPVVTWNSNVKIESKKIEVPRTPQIYNPPNWYKNWGYQIPKKSKGNKNLPNPSTSSPAPQTATSTPDLENRLPFKAKTMDCLKIQPASSKKYRLNPKPNQMKATKIPYLQKPVKSGPSSYGYGSHPNEPHGVRFHYHQHRNVSRPYGASCTPL